MASVRSPRTLDFHAGMAVAYRRTEERHLVASKIHLTHARRLERWAHGGAGTSKPRLIAAVASAAGAQSAALSLRGRNKAAALVSASDTTSRIAYELELTFAEGPARDAMAESKPVVATGKELPTRWPYYGPALRQLGIQVVAAVGLRTAEVCLGSLTVFDPHRSGATTSQLAGIATAVVHSVLLAPDAVGATGCLPTLTDFEQEDFQPLLHQAAGKIHAECGCGVDTAIDLVRAHAFSENRPVAAVARDVLHGVLTLP